MWFCLATLACGYLCGRTSAQSLPQADRDDICEIVFKHYGKFGGFQTDLIFLAMPDGLDPKDDFMARFRGYQPKAEKASRAYHAPSPSQQVRHKVTNKDGVIVHINNLTMLTNGTVQVDVRYDMFSLGGGTKSFILFRKDGRWSISQEIRGVVY